MTDLAARDKVAFDHVGDGTIALRWAWADHAEGPATDYGARPSWVAKARTSK